MKQIKIETSMYNTFQQHLHIIKIVMYILYLMKKISISFFKRTVVISNAYFLYVLYSVIHHCQYL